MKTKTDKLQEVPDIICFYISKTAREEEGEIKLLINLFFYGFGVEATVGSPEY